MLEAVNQVIEGFGQFHWTEKLALITGLIYVILAAREQASCWIWGIISSSAWAFATATLYNLYVDALLQFFYVLMGFWGLYQWRFGANKSALPITTLPIRQHAIIILGGLLLTFPVGYFFASYTSAAATYIDALTTIFSIVATFLTVYKKLENWLYWIVTDAIYIYLYTSRGALIFAFLMVVYLVIAGVGYFSWRKKVQSIHL